MGVKLQMKKEKPASKKLQEFELKQFRLVRYIGKNDVRCRER